MASQSLLFEQLSDSLQTRAGAKFVLLRSGDASNLKAALRKIILEFVATRSDAPEEQDLSLGNEVCARARVHTCPLCHSRCAYFLCIGQKILELRPRSPSEPSRPSSFTACDCGFSGQ